MSGLKTVRANITNLGFESTFMMFDASLIYMEVFIGFFRKKIDFLDFWCDEDRGTNIYFLNFFILFDSIYIEA